MPQGPGSASRGKRPLSGVEGEPSSSAPSPPQHAAPPPPPLDFGTYMAVKSAKLRVQFDEQRAEKRRRAALGGANGGEPSASSPSAATSDIFSGVVIHVNGITVPCALDLKEIMLRHGGGYEYRPMDPRITHTVAANLADTKAINLAKSKGSGSVFVRPEWVTASLAAGRPLTVAAFLLRPPGMNLPGQRQLFAEKEQQGAATTAGQRLSLARKDPDRGAAARRAAAARGVWPAAPAAAPAAPAPAAPATTSPPPPSSSSAAEALAAAKRARAACDLLRGPPKSTADLRGPDGASAFVGGFYRASRLHFIGSWRTRFEALVAKLQLEDDEERGRGGGVGGEVGREVGRHPIAAAFAPPPLARGTREGDDRLVIHLDMDCFFASVSLSRVPAYRGHPHVVCHSDAAADADADDDQFAGGEVACPCYLARSFGIRAGMGVAAARRLCPSLIAVPYEFEEYARASDAMYSVLLRCGRRVQPLSVDEALVDASGMEGGAGGAAAELAAALRRAVFEATGGCAASCGVGPNPLLARLATKRAKPDGLKVLGSPLEAEELLLSLPCDALPGVGWSSSARLEAAGLRSVAEIRAAGKEALAAALAGVSSNGRGTLNNATNNSNSNSNSSLNATVQALWDAAHGRDARAVVPLQPRRSVGAECNWGVRFRDAAAGGRADAAGFLLRLSLDLARRLRAAGALPGALTLKLKVRRAGAGLPRKHLGHGVCDAFSKTTAVAMAAAAACCEKGGGGGGGGGSGGDGGGDGDDGDAALASLLASVGRGLLQSLNPKPEDIRGMGLVASKLVPVGGAARMMTAALPPGSAEKRKRQTDLNALLVPRRPGDSSLSPPGAAAAAKRSGADSAAVATTPQKLPQEQQQQQQKDEEERQKRETPRRAPSVPLPCEGWTFDSDSGSSSPESASSSGDDAEGDSESGSSESEGEGDDGVGENVFSSSSQALSDVVALSQVDASVFDALPLRLQRELLAGLTESSKGRESRRRKTKSEAAAGRVSENAAPKQAKKKEKKKEKKKGEEKKGKGKQRRGGRRRRSVAIVPLPRPEELDREVLDALPLPLRWEIERALREEEEGERGGGGGAHPFPPHPPQLRQARLDRSGFLSPPLAAASAEKKKKKAPRKKNPGSSSASRRPSSRTATPSPSPSAKGKGRQGGGGGWTTPGSAAARRRRPGGLVFGAVPPLSAVAEADEGEGEGRGEEDDFDFGGVAVAEAVLSVAAAEGGAAAAPAFELAAEWARGALLDPRRGDAEGARRVARALLKVSRSDLSDRPSSASSSSSFAAAAATAAAEAARSALLRVQEAAVECFGAPLLLETRGERLLRLRREATAVEEDEEAGARPKGAAAAASRLN